jgi:hypothetical protein
MTKGSVVPIYKDPFTEQQLEGNAKLLEKLEEDGMFETWFVVFEGETDRDGVSRRILKQKS